MKKINLELNKNAKVESLKIVVSKKQITFFYIESLIDKQLVSAGILQPLQKFAKTNQSNVNLNLLVSDVFTITAIQQILTSQECVSAVLCGKVVVVLENEAVAIPFFGAEKSAIAEPPTSRVVKGPREGFVEDIATNIGLVRKRLKTTNLQIEDCFTGKIIKTQTSRCFHL